MHRSQLGGVIIDCRTDDLEAAADFWSRALGYEVQPSSDPADESYIPFKTAPPGDLDIEVQKVEHESRVHIDIETDDIPAEVARLEGLGAKRLKQIRDWVVLEAPTGHRFCVVPAKRAGFAREAKVWD